MLVNWIIGKSGASGSLGSGGTASGAVAAVGTASGFCRWGSLVPIHNFSAFRATVELVVGHSWAWGSTFIGGFGLVAMAVLLVGEWANLI